MAKSSKFRQRNAIQTHHISYYPEVTVQVFKKEHWILTQINRFNPVSKGFLEALRYYIEENKDRAIDLNKIYEFGVVKIKRPKDLKKLIQN